MKVFGLVVILVVVVIIIIGIGQGIVVCPPRNPPPPTPRQKVRVGGWWGVFLSYTTFFANFYQKNQYIHLLLIFFCAIWAFVSTKTTLEFVFKKLNFKKISKNFINFQKKSKKILKNHEIRQIQRFFTIFNPPPPRPQRFEKTTPHPPKNHDPKFCTTTLHPPVLTSRSVGGTQQSPGRGDAIF